MFSYFSGAGVLSLYDKAQEVMFGKVYSGGMFRVDIHLENLINALYSDSRIWLKLSLLMLHSWCSAYVSVWLAEAVIDFIDGVLSDSKIQDSVYDRVVDHDQGMLIPLGYYLYLYYTTSLILT